MTTPIADPTFRTYTTSQARAYALGRGTSHAYPLALYSLILSHHESTGGRLGTLLDVGCGHGSATRDLAPSFQQAIGIDPSIEMINMASSLAGETASGGLIRFVVGDAEACDQIEGLEEDSVDVITSAMAAHWFDMPRFWTAAARVLKPGGTVALWTCSSLYAHTSMQNHARVQEILFELERGMLAPFELPGNRVSRDGYVDLQLPWDVIPAVRAFDRNAFVRHDWNKDGEVKPDEPFFNATAVDGQGFEEESLEELEKGLDTASMVTRWREAHRHLVGTDEDCVKKTIKALRETMGSQKLRTGNSTSLLLFKKKVVL